MLESVDTKAMSRPGLVPGLTKIHTYADPSRLAEIFYLRETPEFLLGADGTLLEANLAARRLIELRILSHTPGFHLVYGTEAVNTRASRCIETCVRKGESQRMLKRLSGTEWLIFDFSPIATGHRTLISLGVHTRMDASDIDMNTIAEAFDMTAQEARVAAYMCQALSAKEIAREMDISPNTVRAHLRAVYAKCGRRGYHNTLTLLLSLLH